MLGAKQTSPDDHPGKTVLHSLELDHVPNCDTMQQEVAVVKPAAHKGRRQALGLVQIQLFSDNCTGHGCNSRKVCKHCSCESSPEIKIFIKHNTIIFSSCRWVSLTAKESDWKHGRCFILWRSWPMRRNSVFIGIEFKFAGTV